MRFLSLLFTISLASLALANDEHDEHVLDMTQDNFESIITENDMVLVKFYAPWCGHCKSFAPEYAKAAKMLADEGSNIKLGKVDATIHTELASKYKIQGYPTVKFFRKGEPMEYSGPRVADGVVTWLKKKTGPPLVVVSSQEELDKLKKEHPVLAVILSTDEASKEYKIVHDIASKTDSISFAHIKDAALGKEHGFTGATKFMVLKQFDDPKVEFVGSFEQPEIENFIKVEKVPLVTEFSQETAQAVFESEIKVHVIAFSNKKGEDYKKHMELLKQAALKLKGNCHVVIIDMDDPETHRVGDFFAVTDKDTPTFRVLKMKEEMLKFQPEKSDFTAEYIESFTKDVLEGKVQPHLKSQKEPEDWDKDAVKVLVAKTFRERAVNKDKAVFVKFYAPWCGHCKTLIPIWEDLAKAYEGNDEVIIGKCDATENEFENIKISSFPTLKFSPKGSDEWIDYSGERTKEGFMKFVDANGKMDDTKPTEEKKHDEL